MWNIDRTDDIAIWIESLDDDSKEAILKHLFILQEIGPTLGRPHVDKVKSSQHTNMKELRIQVKQKVLRILFAFDPSRKAILLVGGDKRGDKEFYEKMIRKADILYNLHLANMEKDNERKK